MSSSCVLLCVVLVVSLLHWPDQTEAWNFLNAYLKGDDQKTVQDMRNDLGRDLQGRRQATVDVFTVDSSEVFDQFQSSGGKGLNDDDDSCKWSRRDSVHLKIFVYVGPLSAFGSQ